MSVCILGGRKGSQLEQNMEAIAAAKKLNKDTLKKIDEILDNKPKGDMMMAQTRFAKYITDPL